jgi:Bacterial self-protective colicin-like immunity
MSRKLLSLSEDFLKDKSDLIGFSSTFSREWKVERDNGTVLVDNARLSETLSSIFCLVDMFNPEDDRENHEFDESALRKEITSVLTRLNSAP